jgi:Transposase IS116/IS110/IS902 family
VAAGHGYDRSASYRGRPGPRLAGRAGSCPRPRGRSSPTAWRSPAGLAPVTGRIDGELHQHARGDPRVKVLRTLPGVGEFTALVMVAEIGDITRFGSARKLASWAGLTPTVRGSDLKVRHGHIPGRARRGCAG